MATVVTKTIKPGGGGDYTTLAAWAAARLSAALVDTVERAECYAGNAGDISSAISVDSTSRIEIVAATGFECKGIRNSSVACIETSSSPVAGFTTSNFTIQGISIYSTSSAGYAVVNNGSGIPSIKDCLIGTNGSASYGFYGGSGTRGRVENSIFYGFTVNAIQGRYDCTVDNCTFYECYRGIRAVDSGVVAKNCLAQACTDGFNGTFGATSDYNCSDIASDAPGAHSVTGTVQFVDATNNDYHLDASDTVARGAGVNLTSSGITTDIDGETRPATGAWDIGADQYVAPAPTGPWGTPKFGISQPFGAQKFGVTPWM